MVETEKEKIAKEGKRRAEEIKEEKSKYRVISPIIEYERYILPD